MGRSMTSKKATGTGAPAAERRLVQQPREPMLSSSSCSAMKTIDGESAFIGNVCSLENPASARIDGTSYAYRSVSEHVVRRATAEPLVRAMVRIPYEADRKSTRLNSSHTV